MMNYNSINTTQRRWIRRFRYCFIWYGANLCCL